MPYKRRYPYRRRRGRLSSSNSVRGSRSSSYGRGMGSLSAVRLRPTSLITTGIQPKKMIKLKQEIIHSYQGTGNTSNSYIYVTATQNPNAGAIQWYTGDSGTYKGLSADGAAGTAQWLAFYNSFIVKGCKVRAEIVNLMQGTSVVVDMLPTVDYTLGYGANSTSVVAYDSMDIEPQEQPNAKRIVLGPSGGQSKGVIKQYYPIRKLIGVKDLEDVFAIANGSIGSSPNIIFPKVPNINSTSDSDGHFTGTGSVFSNIVLTSMNSFTDTPLTPVVPVHTIRITATYYCLFRDRKPLSD